MNSSRSIEKLISEFCDIILTEKDNLSIQEATIYIESLTPSERQLLVVADFHSPIVSCVLKDNLNSYILKFQNVDDYKSKRVLSPFEFDSGTNFVEYQKKFEELYVQSDTLKTFPKVFHDIFVYIDNISEHYRIFEQFYNVRSQRALAPLIQRVRSDALALVTEKVTEFIEESVDEVVKKASTQAFYETKATSDAIIRKADEVVKDVDEKATNAIKSVNERVETVANSTIDAKMAKVTTKISETSVAILGIFSGIVLAVVAGLFYSSSVLENMVDVSLYRLICISSLVGFICFNLIAVMFLFIERFRTSEPVSESNDSIPKSNGSSDKPSSSVDVNTEFDEEKEKKPSSKTGLFTFLFKGVTRFVNIALLIIMISTFLLEVFFPIPATTVVPDGSNINISGDVNVSMNDTVDTETDILQDSEVLDTTFETDQETDEIE